MELGKGKGKMDNKKVADTLGKAIGELRSIKNDMTKTPRYCILQGFSDRLEDKRTADERLELLESYMLFILTEQVVAEWTDSVKVVEDIEDIVYGDSITSS